MLKEKYYVSEISYRLKWKVAQHRDFTKPLEISELALADYFLFLKSKFFLNRLYQGP